MPDDPVTTPTLLFDLALASENRRLREVLVHIATMDCYTREGEEPIHLLMMRLAQEALDND